MGIHKITPEVLRVYGPKCARCWKFGDRVGQWPKHPDLCPRCADVVEGATVHEEFESEAKLLDWHALGLTEKKKNLYLERLRPTERLI